MQPAEKNEDSATQSGRRGDNDDEVISTTVFVQNTQLMVKRQCQRTTRSIRWSKYSIVRLETQFIDTDELKFFHTVFIMSADKPARRARKRNDTQSGGEFRNDAVRERRYLEGTSESRRETQDTWAGAVENVEVAEIECVETMMSAELTEKSELLNLRHRIQFIHVDPEHVAECKPHSQSRLMRISRSGIEGHKEQAATREHRY